MTIGSSAISGKSAANLGKWLRTSMVAMVVVLPLAVVPGFERPFSSPKHLLLIGFVAVAGIFAIGLGRFNWPKLTRGLRAALILWPSVLVTAALLGDFSSPDVLLLFLFAQGWFVLAIAIRPPPLHLATALCVACALVAVIALLQFAGLDPFALLGMTPPGFTSARMRVYATLGNPNFVSALLVAGMPLTWVLGRLPNRRPLYYTLFGLEALAVLATGSRAGLIAAASGIGWLGALGLIRPRVFLGVGLLAIVLTALAPSRALITVIDGRLYIWRVSLSHVVEAPLLGFGPGAFEPKYIEWETGYWRDGKGKADERRFAALQEHAHNDYIEITVGCGLVGLAGFLLLLGSFLVFAFQRAKLADGELTAGASAGVMALAVTALVDFPFHRPAELFFFWTLMALVCMESPPLKQRS